MFCVECGKEDTLYTGLCSECYLLKNTFVTIPKQIDVEVCSHCGVRKKGKSWILGDEEDFIEDIVRENVTCHQDVEDFDIHLISQFKENNNVSVGMVTHASVLGLKAEEEHKTKIKFKKSVCTECSKLAGGYWEAKVQLRASKRGLSKEDLASAKEVVESLVKSRGRKDKSSFLTKIERIHNGLDFYLGSKSLGKTITEELANKFGGQIKESHKLVGRKNGKDMYKTTYAVRLFAFRVGDFIQIENKVHQVMRISPNKVLLENPDSGEISSKKPEELEDAKLLGGKELVVDMVVVSRSENEIQVLDPENLKTVDMLLPKGFDASGESVRVFKCEAGYFLVR